jgi:hypothetical protein
MWVSKIFRTDAVILINPTTKRFWKLPTSTQLRVTWQTDSLDMLVLPFHSTSRCYNRCIDGGTSPEIFGCILVCEWLVTSPGRPSLRETPRVMIYRNPKELRQSQWPRGLRRRSVAAGLPRLWVRIPTWAWMSVVSVACYQAEASATSWSLI